MAPLANEEEDAAGSAAAAAAVPVVVVRLRVGGMLCMENCGRGVERALAACRLPAAPYAVAAARVDFPARLAHVTLTSTSTASASPSTPATAGAAMPPPEVVAALRRAVEEAGYEVEAAAVLRPDGREEGLLGSAEAAAGGGGGLGRRRPRPPHATAASGAAAVGMEIRLGGLTWCVG